MAKLALLIGVSEYEPGLNPLPAAAMDVQAIQKVLQHPEIGGFAEADVQQLVNPDPQKMAEMIEGLFSDRHKEDLVLLYFSGHGIKDDSGKLHLATRITRKNAQGRLVKSTAVPASFVHNIMSDSRSKRQVVILDCCFSGAFAEGWSAKDDGSVDIYTQLGGEGRVVLTSSTSTQYSFEHDETNLSIYTRYLVEGIETGAADLDNDGAVSVDELHEYAKKKVQETAPAMRPEIYAVKEGFKIRLTKAPISDPKLRYRKEVERFASRGVISTIGRSTLDLRRESLGLLPEDAAAIEAEVLKPYQEYQKRLQKYEQVLVGEIQKQYPLSSYTRNELNSFQEALGLRDEDIEPIVAHVVPQPEQASPKVLELIETPTDLYQKEEKSDASINEAVAGSKSATPVPTGITALEFQSPRKNFNKVKKSRLLIVAGVAAVFVSISAIYGSGYLTFGLSKQATDSTPEQGNGSTPEQGNDSTPEQGNGSTPEQGNGSTPEQGNGSTPEQGNGSTPEQGNGSTPEQGNDSTPEQGNDSTPEQGNDSTPEQGNDSTPEQGNDSTPEQGNDSTPEQGNDSTPEQGNDSTPEQGNDSTPEQGNDSTPEQGNDSTPEQGNDSTPEQGNDSTPEQGTAILQPDCLPYNPANLQIVNEGASGWLLTDDRSRMLILDNEADAKDALSLAKRHTAHCFLGRNNSRPNRKDYIVEYWTGNSGLTTTIAQQDCIPYNSANLQIVDEGTRGWLLSDGRSRMLILDNEADAKDALVLAKRHTAQCFLGRNNSRPDRKSYIVEYWQEKP